MQWRYSVKTPSCFVLVYSCDISAENRFDHLAMTNILLGTSKLEGSLMKEPIDSERGKELNRRRSPHLDAAELKTCEDDSNGPMIDSSLIVENPTLRTCGKVNLIT
jgi:hypothetical protein